MKKLLLATLITGASLTATADVVVFDDSSFNGMMGSEVVFDFIDYDSDVADVTQTDTDMSGDITGAEDFSEMGSTDVVNFKLGAALLGVDPAYEVFYDYMFTGTATTVGGAISVDFDTGPSGLYVDTIVNGVLDGGSTKVAGFSLLSGGCSIDISPGPLQNKGFCAIDLVIDFEAGYFFNTLGDDLSTTPSTKTAELIVTVQDIIGLDFLYMAPGDSQTFEIEHDGNMKFNVPEPATVAILGLGLLGFAGMRRRKT